MGKKRKPKVVHVATVGITGTKLLLPQCAYFRELGLDVSFVFSPGPEAQTLTDKGFVVREIEIAREIRALRDLTSIRHLRDHFREVRPDIVHTHTSKAGIAGRISARLSSVPIIAHTVHGFPFNEGTSGVKKKLYQGLEKLGARCSTIIFSQSREDVDIAERLGIRGRGGGLIHIGNGIDVHRFHPERFPHEARSRIRRQLNLPSETIILCTIARVNQMKGYGDLIDAVAKLPRGDWHLLCIGGDEGYMGKVADKIKRLSLEKNVSMLGEREDIEEVLSISDIYILPSYREGVPRSVIEAQAMEVPAVVTDIRGSREIVLDERSGLIVPTHDPEALADAIGSLMNNEEVRKKFGKAGRERVVQAFDESLVFRRIASEYERLLAERGLSLTG